LVALNSVTVSFSRSQKKSVTNLTATSLQTHCGLYSTERNSPTTDMCFTLKIMNACLVGQALHASGSIAAFSYIIYIDYRNSLKDLTSLSLSLL